MAGNLPELDLAGVLITDGRELSIVQARSTPHRVKRGDYIIDVTVAGVAVVLPGDAPVGTEFEVFDGFGTSSATPIVITADGGTTINGAASYSLATDRGGVRLVRGTSGWVGFGFATTPSGTTFPAGTGFLTVTGGVLDNPLLATITTTQDINASDIGASGFLTAGTAVESGATPAHTGNFRGTQTNGANSVILSVRNTTDTAEIPLIEMDGFDSAAVGASVVNTTFRGATAIAFSCSAGGTFALFTYQANWSFFTNAPSFGGGAGVAYLKNATTVPTSDPATGSILYVEAGATKVRGSGGTITTIAPA